MQSAWEHNKAFFVQNAVKAVYNEKGYFNIKSGKHRMVFLIVMGQRYVPLKIGKGDYEKWRDEKRAARIYELLDASHKTELPCIPDSPYFYEYPCNTSDFYGRLLCKLTGILYSEEYRERNGFYFEGEKILLDHTPLAFYAHVFGRMGFQVTIYEEDKAKRELIDAVTGRRNVYAAGEIGVEEPYFLVVMQNGEGMPLKEHVPESRYLLLVTGVKSQTEKAILSGCSEEGFLYAFLQRGVGSKKQ